MMMGKWKACVPVCIGPALRVEMEEIAAGEQRCRGHNAVILLKWGFEQLILRQEAEWPHGRTR
jgi:hypothetical protein